MGYKGKNFFLLVMQVIKCFSLFQHIEKAGSILMENLLGLNRGLKLCLTIIYYATDFSGGKPFVNK